MDPGSLFCDIGGNFVLKKFRVLAIAALTPFVLGIGLVVGPSSDAAAAKWISTGKVFGSANACDKTGRWYVYDFYKIVGPNNQKIGHDSYDCMRTKDGQWLLWIHGFVEK